MRTERPKTNCEEHVGTFNLSISPIFELDGDECFSVDLITVDKNHNRPHLTCRIKAKKLTHKHYQDGIKNMAKYIEKFYTFDYKGPELVETNPQK